MEAEIREILDNYYELTEQEEASAFKKIREYAETQPEQFKTLLQSVDRRAYGFLIDALFENTNKWSSLFFDEIKRIFETADKSDDPNNAILFIDEYSFMDYDDFTHAEALVDYLKQYLKHRLPAFRFWAVSLIADFIEPTDRLRISILEQLQKDPDWRIRYWVYQYLTELRGKGRYKLSFMDKLKAKLMNPDKFD